MNTVLIACFAGFFCGWLSAVGSVLLLRDRPKTGPEPEARAEPEPEARAEPEPEAPEMSPEEKRFLEELDALWNYDGKGGGVSGDKENS